MKKGGKAECCKADRLKMGKRPFRSRRRAADKAGGNFRGTGKPAAWLQNRSGRTAGRIGGTAFPNQRAACDKNRRTKRVWKAIPFIVGGIIAVYVLILILATVLPFSPERSDTTDSSQSIESIVEKE